MRDRSPRRHLRLKHLGLCLMLAGCAAITTVPVPERAPVMRRDGLLTLIGAVHVHSFRSHDSEGTDQEIERAAERAGLDFVLFTEHRRERRGAPGREWQSDHTLFIPGFEINFAGGSLFLFGAPPGFATSGEAEDLARAARDEGAVLGLGHLEQMQPPEGMAASVLEVYNLHAAARDASKVPLVAAALFLPAGAFVNHLSCLDHRALAFVDRPDQPRSVFLGGDVHANVRILWGLLGTIASYDDVFRSITTHVLARQKDRDAILDALARGQSYGVFARQGDAQGFEFCFERGDAVVPMGGAGTLGRDQGDCGFRVRVPLEAQITLTRDGQVVARQDGVELTYRPNGSGRYRVLAWRDQRPWIISSAIDLRE